MDNLLEPSLLTSLRAQYGEVEDLIAVEDLPTNPYKSKYAARSILESLISLLSKHSGAHSSALTVHFLTRLGAVDHEVEELAKSEQDLTSALSISKTILLKSRVIIPELVCLNQLGILWSSRGDFEKAKHYLLAALDEYREFKASAPETIYDIHDLLDSSAMIGTGFPDKERAIDVLNTHTYYYLAQVCEKCGQKDKAAEYCHITLRKQLDLKEYQPLDWVINAWTLSHYYLVQNKFGKAKHHVAAAKFVLEKHRSEVESKEYPEGDDEREKVEEALRLASANIDRAWGRYCYVLLSKSHDDFLAVASNNPTGDDMVVQNIEDDVEELDGVFPSVEADPAFDAIPTKLAKNFEEAREIFLPGQRHLNSAKLFFSIDEHCTDYTEINQDLSTMNKYMANFEPDMERRFKIHKRRVDLLEAPLKELSERVYLLLCRQLLFELAETHESMMDAKLDKMNSAGVPSSNVVNKVNSIIDKSVGYFMRYLDTFKNTAGEMPDEFAAENIRPVLVAYFHLGRLFDKYVVPDRTEQKLQNKVKVYFYFKKMVEYCDRHPEAEQAVRAELPPCREMVKLLPIKIEKMKLELRLQQGTSS